MKKTITNLMAFAVFTLCYNSNAQITDDVGIESVVTPANGSTLTLNNSYTVTIVIKNFGSATVTQIPVQFAVGTNTPITGTCTAFISAGDTAHYTFQTQLMVTSGITGAGTVYTSLGTDGNSSNDQLNLNYNFGTTNIKDINDFVNFSIQNTTDQNTINLIFDKNYQPLTIEIFDLAGKLLKKEKITSGCTIKEINISDLTNGTYIAKLESSKGITTKKFIK